MYLRQESTLGAVLIVIYQVDICQHDRHVEIVFRMRKTKNEKLIDAASEET